MEDTAPEKAAFKYEPLPPNHIRLISLFGIPINAFPEKINCRFEVHHIDHLPEYDAISYAWGNEPATKDINCLTNHFDHGTIQASPHLWQGLGTIMHKAPSLLCWLDFLSINQDDIEEKERQIPLMTQIYGRATNVVVWLGEPEPIWDQGIMNLETLVMVTGLLQLLPSWEALPTTVMLEPAWQAVAAAILRMNRLPWFRRSWVCQEVILAKNVVVLYGMNMIPWDLLYELQTAIFETNFANLMMTEISDNDPNQGDERFNSLGSIHELRNAHQRKPGSIRTDRLIQLIRSTAVSKLEDKVFCTLGLLDPDIAKEIAVDYSKPYEEVYLQFAQAVITRDKTLSLLANTAPLPPTAESISLPSWCPDLSRHTRDRSGFLNYEYYAGFEDMDLQKNRTTLLPQGLHISVPGFRLGVVSEVAPRRPDMGVPTEAGFMDAVTSTVAEALPWFEAVDELIARALKPRGCSDAEIRAATWRVHIAEAAYAYLTPDPNDPDAFIVDKLQAFYPACELMGEAYDVYLKVLRHGNLMALLSGDANVRAEFEKFMAESNVGQRELRLFEAWAREWRAYGLLRIFRTENGLVGIGPGNVQVGDVACVLYDAGPIILLRDTVGTGDAEGKACFQSVGEGYVHGFMELAKTPKEFRDKQEDFIIG